MGSEGLGLEDSNARRRGRKGIDNNIGKII
jgi:hypothetical protein